MSPSSKQCTRLKPKGTRMHRISTKNDDYLPCSIFSRI
jgi:hypothetical protein